MLCTLFLGIGVGIGNFMAVSAPQGCVNTCPPIGACLPAEYASCEHQGVVYTENSTLYNLEPMLDKKFELYGRDPPQTNFETKFHTIMGLCELSYIGHHDVLESYKACNCTIR